MKIFDCFLFNNENLILDIRFNTLSKYVDKFIVVESRYDHQGNKKKLTFDIKNFKNFEYKIIYLVIEKFPEKLSNWQRENFQRNYIMNGLSIASDEDYIIISDVDEIPDLTKIKKLDNFKFTVFEQKMYYYKINLVNKTNPFWYGSKICKKKYLKSPQWLRDQKVKEYPFWKFYKIKWNIIKNGGWHFSFLMHSDEIRKKLTSFAHSEYNNKKYKNLKKIQNAVINNVDLFDRPILYEKDVFDKTFPDYVVNNKEKFKDWIL
jgi:beta-1,4-mannosyl-glycoprotein beta-1,4-N-acetylglucosaminyltransferase